MVAYLGSLSKPVCEGIQIAAEDRCCLRSLQLFDEDLKPEFAQIDTRKVRVERAREFGGVWIALHLMGLLGLNQFFWDVFAPSRAAVGWPGMAMVLVACRLCSPSSELQIAQTIYRRTALEDLLALPCDLVNDDRLYRTLDRLLEHKAALETHLKMRLGELFGLTYDLLLYDVTSTFIEGEGESNDQMKRGYSRDQRPDCKQVCIALVVSRCGMPLGYEVFDGNRTDVTTVEEIVTTIEERYGKADRIWVMDRGMMSKKNLEFLKKDGRRYILGASRGSLRKFEQDLIKDDWTAIRDGLEVKKRSSEDGKETFILCRSRDRKAKEEAIHAKFEQRIEDELNKIVQRCAKQKLKAATLDRRIGALLAKNSRARSLFKVEVKPREDGGSDLVWSKNENNREWSQLSEGCYLLRSNINNWSAEELWKAYIQLTEAETAFRIQKSDLQLRPIWHQKKERVQAHILVCFLAYVLWKTFGQLCKRAGLGDEPRQIFDELAHIKMVDVVMQTKEGVQIRRRCIADPEKHQKVLLDMLRFRLPRQMRIEPNVVETF
ncbi:MAG: IS1634 family transposase [Patescibacteria group bacterium]|nr:IS1634 family transposase [Patescibacteria group bacterium]